MKKHRNKTPRLPVSGKKSGLAKRLGVALVGTDDVEVGKGIERQDVSAGSMAEIMKTIEGVRYLVKNWIPFGMLTMLLGAPGIGKSAFALGSMAKPIIVGNSRWFSSAKGPRNAGFVLWCDTEGSAAITVQRIKDWGLPPNRIKVPFADDPLRPIDLANDEHIGQIRAVVVKYKIKLVVVDSLRGSHGGDENSSGMVRVLQNLAAAAEETKAAVVVIHHTKKLAVDEEINSDSSRGSNAIVAMVRSQLALDRPDKESDWCRLQMLKENLGLRPKPVGFRVTNKGLEFGEAPRKPHKDTKKDEAAEWLRERMEPGKAYLAGKILEEAKQDGFAERTIRKAAKDVLGVVSEQKREDGLVRGWVWRLPSGRH